MDFAPPFHRITRPGLAFSLIFIAACVLLLTTKAAPTPQVTHDPASGIIRYTFPTRLCLPTATSSLLALVAAYLFATSRGLLIRLFAFLPFLVGLVLAAAARDVAISSVTIIPASLTLPARGFPFRPTPTVSFADVTGVIFDDNERELRFVKSDGTTLTIPIGDLVAASLPNIFQALDTHHVPYGTLD